MEIDASGVTTTELLNTIFYAKPEYDILADGTKGRIIAGYDGIMLYGGFGVGKTLDILTALQFVCRYQRPDAQGVRKIKVGVVRESNSAFIENFVSKVEMFNQEYYSKKFVNGFHIYDSNNRAKCIWRFNATYPGENGIFEPDGTVCEIEMHCMAVANAADIKKWKGAEMTVVVFNEMNNYPEHAHDVLSGRKNRYPFNGIDFQFWIGDLNPGLKKDWDYKKFILNTPVGVKVIQYPSPLKWVVDAEEGTHSYMGDRGYFEENLEFKPHRADGYGYWHSLTAGSDRAICNNVMGEYYDGSSGNAVHQSFSGVRHIALVDAPKISDVVVVGVDPGFANGFVVGYFTKTQPQQAQQDALALGLSLAEVTQLDPVDKFNVMYSYAGDGGWAKTMNMQLMPLMESPQLALHRELNRILIVADPRSISKRALTDGTMTIDSLTNAGFPVTVPTNDVGMVVDDIGRRIEVMEMYLKQADRLAIHPRNRKVITAFVSGYVTKSDSNEPDKRKSGEYAELMDALQYILLFKDLGGKIEDHVPRVLLGPRREKRKRIHNMFG